jgi:hypothetical protein
MFRCLHPFKLHKWGRWETAQEGKRLTKGSLLQPEAEFYECGTFQIMRRTCSDCGLQQLKTIKS